MVRDGSIFKCAPPLREPAARDGLWEYLLDGTLASVGSDHSPCRADEKDQAAHGVLGAWGGISGIQHIFQVVYDQGVVRRGLSPTLLARLARDTADVFSLAHRKGALRVGLEADLGLVDPA
ncbi:MAG: amidohydrolase family protein, partial [Planctomycetes bacterium]|nr:amidohydrolase family protein [Planctomycetota bacterium]